MGKPYRSLELIPLSKKIRAQRVRGLVFRDRIQLLQCGGITGGEAGMEGQALSYPAGRLIRKCSSDVVESSRLNFTLAFEFNSDLLI